MCSGTSSKSVCNFNHLYSLDCFSGVAYSNVFAVIVTDFTDDVSFTSVFVLHSCILRIFQ